MSSDLKNVQVRTLFWNGGLSHVLVMDGERVKIYECLDQLEWEDTRVDDFLDQVEEGLNLEFPEFLDQDEPTLELEVMKSEIFEGSALFHLPDGTFVLAEENTRKIRLLDDDSFVVFQSVMGNSGVPYSYIKGTRYTYILSDEGGAFPNELFEEGEDVYRVFYDQELDQGDKGQEFHFELI